jgi:RES domain-containing protein
MEVRTDALYTVPTEIIKGIFYRYIRTKFANEPLSVHGAMKNGGRYNVAGLFSALYLGLTIKHANTNLAKV